MKRAIALLLSVLPGLCLAQHPADIEKKAADQRYFEALLAFDTLPSRRATPESIVSAAKSAWALGLPERAAKEFDRALRDNTLTGDQRGRLLFARGLIEFQEGRHQIASLFAEKAVAVLTQPSPLRAQVWMLWGESLSALGSHGVAEEKYQRTVEEALPEDQPEAAYYLGVCRKQLGKFDEARQSFERVPLRHERAPQAVRALAELALEQRRYAVAIFWLEKGRESYPDSFIDSWVDYALVVSAAGMKDEARVRAVQAHATARYAPSDPWLTLLTSTAEAYYWSNVRPVGGAS